VSGASDALVGHVMGLAYDDLPAPAATAAKTFILDTLGVGVAGARAPLTQKVLSAVRRWGEAGATGAAHVWGGGARLPAGGAAFVNAFQIHCQEYDCVHEPAVVHPLATIQAALLAECERAGPVSGADFIAALVGAVDVAAGLGIAVSSPIRFFRPATAGVFGATLGVARLRGLELGAARDALGYALAFASGTMQAHVEGKPALPVQIANAGRAAIYACDLAEFGMSGPSDALEGPFGYLPLFEERFDLAPVAATLGVTWRIMEVSHKPFPTGRAAQGGIAAMGELARMGVRADAVAAIRLRAPPLIRRLVGRPWTADMTPNYARLCFAYVGARALASGGVGLQDFTPQALQDEAVGALARRIFVEDDGGDDPAAFTPQTAEAVLHDGRVIAVRIDALPGSPDAPLSRAAHLAKFADALAYGRGVREEARAEALIAQVDRLEDASDAGVLARLTFAATLDQKALLDGS
jgi:2-methylcitrate dehydratase PrpD